MGKPAATGPRDLALVRAFHSAGWLAQEGQHWWGLFLMPGGTGSGSWGERGCNGGSTPCTSLNSGSFLLWQSGFLPQAFPVVDFLPPVPSGCLLAANSSWICSPILTFQLSAPVCTVRHASQSGACRAVARTICVGHTLSCLPHTGRFAHF